MLLRLAKIVEGLRERGYGEDANRLESVRVGIKQTTPRDATIQEVLVRTIGGVVREEVTLDGRLVDVLAFLAKTHGISLAMHPLLLVIVALAGRDNPDRAADPEASERLDALMSVMLEERLDYQQALYTVANLARLHGLDATADMAVELMKDIHANGATTATQQATVIEETRLAQRTAVSEDDDLGWVIKLMLTMASLVAVAAVAAKLSGSLKDLIGALDSVVNLIGGEDPS